MKDTALILNDITREDMDWIHREAERVFERLNNIEEDDSQLAIDFIERITSVHPS